MGLFALEMYVRAQRMFLEWDFARTALHFYYFAFFVKVLFRTSKWGYFDQSSHNSRNIELGMKLYDSLERSQPVLSNGA